MPNDIAKVVYMANSSATPEVWMDTTDKTANSGNMLSGTTALKNDGSTATGNIATKTSSDMTVSGATVTAPAGYYASNASKSVASGSASTPATSITANPSISVSSGGLITATASATKSVTPSISAGYVSSGTAGTVSVSGSATEQLSTQAATTYHPSTTDQTIASGKYLTGAQTIKAVVHNLTADKIAEGFVAKIGDSIDDNCVASITGTHSGGGGGLEYEEGTWTPSSDVASATISLSNIHTTPPFCYMITENEGDYYSTTYTNYSMIYFNAAQIAAPYYNSSTEPIYGYVYKRYRTTSATSVTGGVTALTTPYTDTADNSMNYSRFWATATTIKAANGNSQYWRSGRTYKWIAAWTPTT